MEVEFEDFEETRFLSPNGLLFRNRNLKSQLRVFLLILSFS